MSIIEKLGITPGPWGMDSQPDMTGAPTDEFYIHSNMREVARLDPDMVETGKNSIIPNARLISAAPEMLEVLIKFCDWWYKNDRLHDVPIPIHNPMFDVVVKATGKSWQEIQALL